MSGWCLGFDLRSNPLTCVTSPAVLTQELCNTLANLSIFQSAAPAMTATAVASAHFEPFHFRNRLATAVLLPKPPRK